MKLILKKAHYGLYAIFVVLFFVLLYPLLYFFTRKPSRYKTLNKIRRFYAFSSSAMAGIFYRRRYKANVDWSRAYIVCPNHTSNLDVSAVTVSLKSSFAYMGKAELLDNPLLGMYFRTIDIPVNRESNISAFKAFKKGAELLEKGISIIIFPEGKIGEEYPPVLHEFKNGPFRLAIEKQIPILPISIIDIWEKMWDDGLKYGTRPGICDICIHEPIETAGYTLSDVDCLKDKVYSIISSELKR